ncbi:MAG: hypothetical protein QXF43_04205 [Nitrososphaerales archaeon]
MSKVRFGQRLFRAMVYGGAGGGLAFIATNILAKAVNVIAGSTIINEVGYPLLAFSVIFAGALGIELSKDMEE